MKIAFYVPWIYQKGGIERVLINYAKLSKHKITFLTNYYSPKTTFPEFSKLSVVELEKVPIQRNYLDLAKVSLKLIEQKLPLKDFDLLIICSSGFGELVAIKNNSTPVVCYCCTPLKVIHDKKTKNEYLKSSTIKKALFAIVEKVYCFFEKMAWKHIDHTISISKETKSRILTAKLTSEDKISVINPGVNLDHIKVKSNFKKYFLVPGRFIWHKNFELAIKAFELFSKKKKGFKLIIAGGLDEKNIHYFNKLKKMSNNKNIQFITSPTDKELFDLYKNCYAVLFTAINEDFGIVPVEGMAYGKPVISVNEGGPTETVINNKTGFLVEKDPALFEKKMLLLANNLAKTKELGKNAEAHSKSFNWKIITKRIDNTLDLELKKWKK